jgi:anti-sigma B factor antagonist
MEATVNPRIVDGVAVLDVAGELDLYTSPKLKAALDDLLAGGHTRLVVNLQETTYLDSTALAILSSALGEIKQAGGHLCLIFDKPQIARLFSITSLNELFPIFSTETDALEAVRTWSTVPPKA